MFKIHYRLVVFPLLCAGCAIGPRIQEDPTLPADGYTLDFTQSPARGLLLGNNVSLVFTVDLTFKTRAFVVDRLEGNRGQGMLQDYDFVGCSEDSLHDQTFKGNLASFPAGDPSNVGYVDIAMLSWIQEPDQPLGGVCYGYRTPGGDWTFVYDMAPLHYDDSKAHVFAHVPIDKGPVDAIKLFFGGSYREHYTSRVFFTADASN